MKEILDLLPAVLQRLWEVIKRYLERRRAVKKQQEQAQIDADFEALKRAKTVEEKDAALDALHRNWNGRK